MVGTILMKTMIIGALLAFTATVNAQKLVWPSELGGDNYNGAIVGYDLSTKKTEVIASL